MESISGKVEEGEIGAPVIIERVDFHVAGRENGRFWVGKGGVTWRKA